jgi:L-ascorbate metabolism protein UlaG (beta-lactamase superfamily)
MKALGLVLSLILALLILVLFIFGAGRPVARSGPSLMGGAADGATVWYLGHCGYAVRTRDHFLIFDYQERVDGRQAKAKPERPSLASGWIVPEEVKDLKVRVFVSRSHEDHFDPVIFSWRKVIPDIAYYFGWQVEGAPANACLAGPRAEAKSGGLEIATINSHHSGVPEVAWLVEVDGLVIYHNGDCLPEDAAAEHDSLLAKTEAVDIAFVFPVVEAGQKYTIQERDFFKKFRVRDAFPMHGRAGDPMYLAFEKEFHGEFPAVSIHVPMSLGQRFDLGRGGTHTLTGRGLTR